MGKVQRESVRALGAMERKIGHRFRDRALLRRALTHRSWSHESGPERAEDHYERLELLGDALLGFLVADRLFREDPTAAEGTLSRRRQAIVRTSALAAVAIELGLGEALRLGRGEERTGGRRKASLLADALEAVLGAVYLDGGVNAARAFVRRHVRTPTPGTRPAGAEAGEDYKTRLQELVQSRLRLTPSYRIVSTSGPAHALHFEAEVVVAGECWGSGSGSNRKRAEQDAARAALETLAADVP